MTQKLLRLCVKQCIHIQTVRYRYRMGRQLVVVFVAEFGVEGEVGELIGEGGEDLGIVTKFVTSSRK